MQTYSSDGSSRFAVQAQMISELEELVTYKKLADQPQQQQRLRQTWKKRLVSSVILVFKM